MIDQGGGAAGARPRASVLGARAAARNRPSAAEIAPILRGAIARCRARVEGQPRRFVLEASRQRAAILEFCAAEDLGRASSRAAMRRRSM